MSELTKKDLQELADRYDCHDHPVQPMSWRVVCADVASLLIQVQLLNRRLRRATQDTPND